MSEFTHGKALTFTELKPGRLYGMDGYFNVYAYQSPYVGEQVPVAVYEPLAPFFFLGICDGTRDGAVNNRFAEVILDGEICYLHVGAVSELTGELVLTPHEYGPRNEAEIGRKRFHELHHPNGT